MGEVPNFLESGTDKLISDAHPKVILGCVSSVFRRGFSQMISGSGEEGSPGNFEHICRALHV